jgi:hypothetical protein
LQNNKSSLYNDDFKEYLHKNENVKKQFIDDLKKYLHENENVKKHIFFQSQNIFFPVYLPGKNM